MRSLVRDLDRAWALGIIPVPGHSPCGDSDRHELYGMSGVSYTPPTQDGGRTNYSLCGYVDHALPPAEHYEGSRFAGTYVEFDV